ELFDRSMFFSKGEPVELSDTTIWNYINDPKNRAIVDRVRNGQFQYNAMHRPHHHRHSPFHSLSKISLDDRDLPRKLNDGKRVKAYYAYDVASGCVIGYAYSRNKDEQLFLDCLRNTFQMVERNGFGMPMEIEVEHHLVNKFFSELEMMFPYMRICNAGNSQEKRAEHFNRAKKYGTEKKLQKGIGRWWAKSEAYRVDNDKVNNEFKEPTFTFEQLVADDIEAIKQYNNTQHPKMKLYPDQTRWSVLKTELNPDMPHVNKAILYKTIGDKTKTSIRRNQYAWVENGKYHLPDLNCLQKLLPNNYEVDAYYLANDNGNIDEVFLYQHGNYICKCEKIVEYNESKAEQTQKDRDNYQKQAKYVASFDKMTKEGKQSLAKPVIIDVAMMKEVELAAEDTRVVAHEFNSDENIDDILADYDPEEFRKRALNSI
ncbi:MAG: hypothetical protein WCL06_15490, partial [Bacteroidota bacterium]